MNVNDKINFLISSCKKNNQRFPHTLLITEDHSLAKQFASNIAYSMNSNLSIADADSLESVGDLVVLATNLKKGDFLLMQDINLIKKACSQNFMAMIECFRLDLMIENGPSVRSLQVALNEFTLIATTQKLNSIPRSLIGSFFCIIKGEEIRNIGKKSIFTILSDLEINISEEVADYIFSIANQNKIEIESFAKNILNFMTISGLNKNSPLTSDVVNTYLEFSDISNSIEKTYSRHVTSEVKNEVWRRDSGQCVLCKSQERLEYDHIIPFSKGGSNTARNIQLLCESCNRAKSAKI